MGKKSRRQRPGALARPSRRDINDLDVPATIARIDDDGGGSVDVSVGGVTDKSTFRSRASWSAAGVATHDTVLKSVSAKTGARTRRNARRGARDELL